MGFGYLLLGYLCAFLLYMSLGALQLGSLALILGYGLMLAGLWRLCRFESGFRYAGWLCFPLLVTSLYFVAEDLATLFLWNIPFLGGIVAEAVEWASFLLLILLQMAMLYGIGLIAENVGLKRTVTAAKRNSILVAAYALVYLLGRMLPIPESVLSYVTLAVTLLNLGCVLCNLVLLLSCTKNICPEGDEEVAPRESQFAIVNRVGKMYRDAKAKLDADAHAQGEEIARRQEERRKQRQHKKKRKK